jgi:GxxExxY protein
MSANNLSYTARGAIFKVYNALGPGLLESVYEAALECEFKQLGINVKKQVRIPIIYNGIKLEGGYRIDLILNDQLLIEIKSVDEIHPIHHKQVLTYLKLSKLPLGLLVNFNTADISRSIYRKIIDYDVAL